MIQQFCDNTQELLESAELLQNFMVPFEYGLTTEQKIKIAKQVVAPLCEKIKEDMLWWRKPQNMVDEDYWKYRKNDDINGDVNSPWRHVRTRLYFTSASHMYSLFNILFHGLVTSPPHRRTTSSSRTRPTRTSSRRSTYSNTSRTSSSSSTRTSAPTPTTPNASALRSPPPMGAS